MAVNPFHPSPPILDHDTVWQKYSLFAEVLSGGKKAEYFERLRWECPLRYDEGLSIFAGLPVRWGWRLTYIGVSLTTSSNAIPLPCLSTLKKWSVVSGSRDSENDASSIFEKAIMLGVWLSRFGGRCLFDFGASNLVGSVVSNLSKGWACLLVYLATKHKG
ncbi:hypothetical protein DVH24_004069 [Malus domestica]|uniref:Uncharacterized protein n=1 Tax=Malus domestica TaxID=3750 RepID=A0A498K815_MALDO|nr:hypothetical protein DVH24_004069 [Malus domestica]